MVSTEDSEASWFLLLLFSFCEPEFSCCFFYSLLAQLGWGLLFYFSFFFVSLLMLWVNEASSSRPSFHTKHPPEATYASLFPPPVNATLLQQPRPVTWCTACTHVHAGLQPRLYRYSISIVAFNHFLVLVRWSFLLQNYNNKKRQIKLVWSEAPSELRRLHVLYSSGCSD